MNPNFGRDFLQAAVPEAVLTVMSGEVYLAGIGHKMTFHVDPVTEYQLVTRSQYDTSGLMSRPDFSTPAQRIAHARRQAGVQLQRDISQSDVARAIGFTPGLVSQWESGKKEPTDQGYHLLGYFLGVAAEWLETGAGAETFAIRREVAGYWRGGPNPAARGGGKPSIVNLARPTARAAEPTPYYGVEPTQTVPARSTAKKTSVKKSPRRAG